MNINEYHRKIAEFPVVKESDLSSYIIKAFENDGVSEGNILNVEYLKYNISTKDDVVVINFEGVITFSKFVGREFLDKVSIIYQMGRWMLN